MRRGVFVAEFIREMARRKVHAMVIGRQALAAYGAPTATNDIDLLVVSEEAERKLCKLAEEFDLVKILEETGGLLYRKKQIKYSEGDGDISPMPRMVDILTIPLLRNFSFETAWKRRVSISLEKGLVFHVPHVDDLIALKHARNAPRDKEDIAWLRRNRSQLLNGC